MIEQVQATHREISHDSRPYAPSWVDRLTNWVAMLSGPSWIYYVGAAVMLQTISAGIKWWDGSVPVGSYPHFATVVIITTFYYPALIDYLDHRAKRALKDMETLLNCSDDEVAELQYRLTTMPARPVWLATLLGAFYGLLILIGIYTEILHFPMMLFSSWAATALEFVLAPLCNALLVIFVYHTFHQLRIVNAIYTQYAEIDLFTLSPLYSFSGLTAQTAIGIVLIESLWLTIDYGGGIEPSSLGILIILLALSVITFLFPLLGIHRILENEKRRLKTEASQLLKKCLNDFKRYAETGEHGELDNALKMIDGAEKQIAILDRIPTWPWQPGTLRGLSTALLLPVLVWLITYILERIIAL